MTEIIYEDQRMLMGLYICETFKSWFDVHPHNHEKVNNIF